MDIPRLQKTLEAAGFTVQWFPTAQAAKEALVARFAGKTIGMGGSVTLRDLGLYEALSQRGTVYWHWQQPGPETLAQAARTPVLLTVRPQGTALTLAALVKGMQTFRTPSQIAGVLLNGCTQRLAELLAPAIQGETSLPVLGYLPQLPGCSIPSRHLGLFTPDEVARLDEYFQDCQK